MGGVAARLIKEEGVIRGFYSGFGPILFKQVPYTMAKFAVQGRVSEAMYLQMNTSPAACGAILNTGVSLSSGVVAGVVSAIISHPADTLLSKVNKAGAGGDGSIPSRMLNITKETGVIKLCTQGLGARCVMIGTLTALQFGIFDTVMRGLGAEKFHFHAPAEPAVWIRNFCFVFLIVSLSARQSLYVPHTHSEWCLTGPGVACGVRRDLNIVSASSERK